jgi:hypothetical protein
MTRDELLVEYKWIFEMYRTFGDDSPFAHDHSVSGMRSSSSGACSGLCRAGMTPTPLSEDFLPREP